MIRDHLYRALRRSQRYTRTDMVYLAKSGGWSAVLRVITTILSLVLTLGLANLIAPETYGQYKYIISIAAVLSSFTLTGIGPAITQAVARGFEGTLHEGTRILLLASSGISLAALTGACYYWLQGNTALAASFIIITITAPIIASASNYKNYLSGKKAFRELALIVSLQKAVVVGALLSSLFFSQDPVVLLATYFGTQALTMLCAYATVTVRYRPHGVVEDGITRFGTHLSVLSLLKKISSQLDKILIFQHLGAVDLATYSFAVAPTTELRALESSLTNIAVPKMSTRPYRELRKSLPRKVTLLMGGMAVVVGIYFAFAPYLFSFLFPQYLASVPLSQVYAFSLVFIPGTFFAKALSVHRRIRTLYILRAVVSTIRIVFLVPAFFIFGLWGLVYATVGVSALVFFAQLGFFLYEK